MLMPLPRPLMFSRLCFGSVCKMGCVLVFIMFFFGMSLWSLSFCGLYSFFIFRTLQDKDECTGTYDWTNHGPAT